MSSGPIATPLGRPVVPDVYAIVVGHASPITSGGSTSGIPAGQPSSTTRRGTSGTCVERGQQLAGHDDRGRAGIGDDPPGLVGLEVDVHRHDDRSEPSARVRRHEELGRVRHEDPHAVAPPYAQPVERVGEVPGRAVQLGVGVHVVVHAQRHGVRSPLRLGQDPGLLDPRLAHRRILPRVHDPGHRAPGDPGTYRPRATDLVTGVAVATAGGRPVPGRVVDSGHGSGITFRKWRTSFRPSWPAASPSGRRPTPPRSGRSSTPPSWSCSATTPSTRRSPTSSAQAGLSNQAFYRHFDGKDALLLALLADGRERLAGTIERRMARAGARDREARVRAWIDAVLDQARDPDGRGRDPAVRRQRRRGSRCSSPTRSRASQDQLVEPLRAIVGADDARAIYHLAMGMVHDALVTRRSPTPRRGRTPSPSSRSEGCDLWNGPVS